MILVLLRCSARPDSRFQELGRRLQMSRQIQSNEKELPYFQSTMVFQCSTIASSPPSYLLEHIMSTVLAGGHFHRYHELASKHLSQAVHNPIRAPHEQEH